MSIYKTLYTQNLLPLVTSGVTKDLTIGKDVKLTFNQTDQFIESSRRIDYLSDFDFKDAIPQTLTTKKYVDEKLSKLTVGLDVRPSVELALTPQIKFAYLRNETTENLEFATYTVQYSGIEPQSGEDYDVTQFQFDYTFTMLPLDNETIYADGVPLKYDPNSQTKQRVLVTHLTTTGISNGKSTFDKTDIVEQATSKFNGIYTVNDIVVTLAEDGLTKKVVVTLKRVYEPELPVSPGLFTFVEQGIYNKGRGYILTSSDSVFVEQTSPAIYSVFTESSVFKDADSAGLGESLISETSMGNLTLKKLKVSDNTTLGINQTDLIKVVSDGESPSTFVEIQLDTSKIESVGTLKYGSIDWTGLIRTTDEVVASSLHLASAGSKVLSIQRFPSSSEIQISTTTSGDKIVFNLADTALGSTGLSVLTLSSTKVIIGDNRSLELGTGTLSSNDIVVSGTATLKQSGKSLLKASTEGLELLNTKSIKKKYRLISSDDNDFSFTLSPDDADIVLLDSSAITGTQVSEVTLPTVDSSDDVKFFTFVKKAGSKVFSVKVPAGGLLDGSDTVLTVDLVSVGDKVTVMSDTISNSWFIM